MSKIAVKLEDGVVSTMGTPHDRFLRDWERSKNPVQVKLIYTRYLADVNTVEQTFKVALGFDLQWPASEADQAEWKRKPETYTPEYVPNFEFPNAKEETKELRSQENGNPFKIDVVDGKHLNFLRKLVYLTCMETFELANFPFDCQDLTVFMDMSFAPVEKAMFVPGAGGYDTGEHQGDAPLLILNRQFCAIPEFECRRVVVEFASRSSAGEEALDDQTFRWSQVVIRFQMVRRSEGYLARIAFLCFLLSVTSISVFALDPVEDLPDRINFLITLVLASVAFQFIVSQYLPQVPYLTLLDKYTLLVFTSTIVLLGIVSLLGGQQLGISEENRAYLDHWTGMGFIAWMLFFQVAFLLLGLFKRSRELHKFDMGVEELKEVNFDDRTDVSINVTGQGLLKESSTVRRGVARNAFLSFAGKGK